MTTKAGAQLNVTECPEMEECKPLGPKSSQIILLGFTMQTSLTHGVSSVIRPDAGRPTHLLPRCIPENCTFSDWSDWQDPTCLGALILVSELPVSPNFPKFPGQQWISNLVISIVSFHSLYPTYSYTCVSYRMQNLLTILSCTITL